MVVRDDWDVSVAEYREEEDLSPLATDAPGQLDVLGHDGDPLGVDSTDIRVLEQANKVSLARLLKAFFKSVLLIKIQKPPDISAKHK